MAGKIQNADLKSLSELTGLGATKTELLNTDKMYSPKTTNVLETDLRKNNDAATTDPAVGNDSSQNYEPGSRWINVTSGKVFACKSNGVGAAVWIEEVNISATQTLASKTLTSPVLNSPSIVTPIRLDVKQDTKANLITYALTATNGQIVFATDTKEYFAIKDTLLSDLGGGGAGVGGTDILSADQADKSAVTDYTQTGLEILDTPIVLHGTKSFRLQHATSIKSFKKVIPVDKKFRGKNNTVWLDVVSTATQGNLNIIFRDETNSVDLTTSQQITTGSLPVTGTTANASNQLTSLDNVTVNSLKVGMVITGSAIPVGTTITAISTSSATMSQNATGVSTGIRVSALVSKQVYSFNIPANCSSLSWAISTVVEANVESYIDDVVVQLSEFAKTSTSVTVPKNNDFSGRNDGAITIGAVTTAPTKGTVVTDRIISTRSGNRLIADYQYEQSAGGTAGSGDYLYSLPSGLSFDSSVIPYTGAGSALIGASKAFVGSGRISDDVTVMQNAQLIAYSTTSFRVISNYTSGSQNFIGSGVTALTGARSLGFHLDAPISGWSSNETEAKTIELSTSQLVQTPDSNLQFGGFTGALASTGNKIFTLTTPTFVNNFGSSIQYVKDSINGDRFIALVDGNYSFSISGVVTANTSFGLTKNASSLTTAFSGLSASERLIDGTTPGAGLILSFSWTGRLVAGDILRLQSDNSTTISDGGYALISFATSGSLKQLNVSSDSKIIIPTHQLRFEGASSRGSTDTAIVKFDTQAITQGDAWDVVNTAANGTVVTMKKAGKLSVSSGILGAAGLQILLTKNQSILTGSPTNASEIIQSSYANVLSRLVVSAEFNVVIGDKIRISATTAISTDISTALNLSLTENSIPANFSNVLPQWSEGDSSVRLNTANGFGSTATKIRRFTNNPLNEGTAITYTDSATNGASFTINENGVYNISFSDDPNVAGSYAGISLNSGSLTANVQSLAVSEVIAIERQSGTNEGVSFATSPRLSKGDVIRVHTDGNASASNNLCHFNISKVGKPNLSSVDVTSFVNMKTTDVEAIEALTATTTSGSTNTGVPVLNITRNTNLGVIRIDSSAANGTSFVALKDCTVNINASADVTANTFVYITRNATILTATAPDGIIERVASNGTNGSAFIGTQIKVNAGDVIRFQKAAAAAASWNYLTLTATADNNATASPTQQVSSDTMSFNFKATAITDTDAIGTFNTYTYAASTNTATIAGTAPTQTVASMNVNGIQVFARAGIATSTAASPSRVDIFIGKGLQSTNLSLFKSTAKSIIGTIDYAQADGKLDAHGCRIKEYNPTTGILQIDAGGVLYPASNTVHTFQFSDNTEQNNGYVTFNASKSPSLVTIPNLAPRIAYLSDVKPSGTAGGSSVAGTQTRTLNTIVDNTGIVTSLVANQFVLPAGTYSIEASAPATSSEQHRIRLRNISDSLTAIVGSSEYIQSTANVTTRSLLSGEITITSLKTFELQHYITTIRTTNGLGVALASGENEVYSMLKITKIK